MFKKMAQVAQKSNYVTNQNGNTASVRSSGPTVNDLTRTGNIGIWHVLRWCEEFELIAEHVPDPATGHAFMELDKIYADQLVFLVSVKCTVGEDLYKLVDAIEPTPLSLNLGLCNVGKTSLGYEESVLDESGRQLALVVRQMVLLDEISRKPVSIPDWWKQTYGSLVGKNKKLVHYALNVPPENTYKYTIKVSWNDTDHNYHVNYLSYIMFCFDAAMDAVQNRFYIGFFDDILKYNVKTLQIVYRNEARAGDNLMVVTWQDAENPRIIHFSIEREGNILVQCSMEFFLRANL